MHCLWINTICGRIRQDSFPRIRVSQYPIRPDGQEPAPARILPHSHSMRSVIGAYGATGRFPRCQAQTRKPQLGTVQFRALPNLPAEFELRRPIASSHELLDLHGHAA